MSSESHFFVGTGVPDCPFARPNHAVRRVRLREAQHHWAIAHIICDLSQPRSFVPKMNNDVLAPLEMMLTFGQMMLCLPAQMKKSNS